jgi:hypothetical protein
LPSLCGPDRHSDDKFVDLDAVCGGQQERRRGEKRIV